MKRNYSFLLLVMLSPMLVNAQTYSQQMAVYRHKYRQSFAADKNSPVKAADTGYIRFYTPDEHYRVMAIFTPTPGSKEFDMPTHSGVNKPAKEYGTVHFTLHGKTQVLHIYQLKKMMDNPLYKDDLFIPFTDETNSKETFGGGRYLDLRKQDIKGNKVILDFNTCYNPSCAYASGYSCPIPPKENDLKIAVKAGEKLFGKKISE